MQRALMTRFAFNPLHKNMLRMTVRLGHRHRALRDVIHVTRFTCLPWFFTSMCLGKRLLAFYHIGDKELVLFEDSQLVALLTNYIPVLPLLPFRKGILHKMARDAKLRIVLSIGIIAIADKSTQHSNDNNKGEDKTLEVFNNSFQCV